MGAISRDTEPDKAEQDLVEAFADPVPNRPRSRPRRRWREYIFGPDTVDSEDPRWEPPEDPRALTPRG